MAIWGCGGAQAPGAAATTLQGPIPDLKVTKTLALTGEGGVHLNVVDLADGTAFIEISGAESPINGIVFRYQRERTSDDSRLTYRTEWGGTTYNVLIREASRFSPTSTWRTFMPESPYRDGLPLTYSEELSAQVNVDAIHRAHLQQTQDGTLAELSRFDRPGEEAAEFTELQAAAAELGEACGKTPTVQIDWSAVDDEQLKRKDVSQYCGTVLDALERACKWESGRRFVTDQVDQVQCNLDGDANLSLTGHNLSWGISFDTVNLGQKAQQALQELQVPGGDQTLGSQLFVDRTAVCTTDDGNHFVVVGPQEAPHGGMAYGDGTTLYKVPRHEMLSNDWFFDPRQRNDQHNHNFRGYDLRFFSRVEVDWESNEGPCTLQCGTREIVLNRLDSEAKKNLLAEVTYERSPHGREPYALARDRRGQYYYVDRGMTPETRKDFRLYRGRRGRLRPLVMRDVVSDSEGEIFESSNGKLRLVVDKEEAQWVARGKTRSLVRLPLQPNYGLIYNELGVYLDARLGVPCDDL